MNLLPNELVAKLAQDEAYPVFISERLHIAVLSEDTILAVQIARMEIVQELRKAVDVERCVCSVCDVWRDRLRAFADQLEAAALDTLEDE